MREASSYVGPREVGQDQQEEREKEEQRTMMKDAERKLAQHSAAQCRTFLEVNNTVPAVVAASMLCCLVVAAYTDWLSKQVLMCPEWAFQCPDSPFERFNSNNIAIVQGLATITYSLGLAAMTYGTKFVCESAIWPLLCKQHFSIKQIEIYLSAARGSIPATSLVGV